SRACSCPVSTRRSRTPPRCSTRRPTTSCCSPGTSRTRSSLSSRSTCAGAVGSSFRFPSRASSEDLRHHDRPPPLPRLRLLEPALLPRAAPRPCQQLPPARRPGRGPQLPARRHQAEPLPVLWLHLQCRLRPDPVGVLGALRGDTGLLAPVRVVRPRPG